MQGQVDKTPACLGSVRHCRYSTSNIEGHWTSPAYYIPHQLNSTIPFDVLIRYTPALLASVLCIHLPLHCSILAISHCAMTTSTPSTFSLDPDHISCIGGRTVVTCQNCAGNAPRYVPTLSMHQAGFDILTDSQRHNLHQLQRPRVQYLHLRTLQSSRRRRSSPVQHQLYSLSSHSKYNSGFIRALVSRFTEPGATRIVWFSSRDEGSSDLAAIREYSGPDELRTC